MRSSCSHNLRSPRAKRYVQVYQNWVKQLVVVVVAATATWPTLCHKLCLTFLFNENESRSLAIQEYKSTCHVGLKDFRLMIVKVKLKLKQWKTVENWENLQLPKHKQVARPHRAHTPLASLRQICLLCFAFIICYIKWSCCGLVSVLPPPEQPGRVGETPICLEKVLWTSKVTNSQEKKCSTSVVKTLEQPWQCCQATWQD